jgi:hypothetical protein
VATPGVAQTKDHDLFKNYVSTAGKARYNLACDPQLFDRIKLRNAIKPFGKEKARRSGPFH